MMYWLFGYFIRREACRCAAVAVREHPVSEGDRPVLLWSLTVFFEQYLLLGAGGTAADFGPKEPATLGAVDGGSD